MLAIPSPAISLLVYCIDCNPTGIWMFDGIWRPLVPAIPNATFGPATINCNGTLAGSYIAGQPLTSINTKTFLIQVTDAGQLTATTNMMNGVLFLVTKLHLTTGTNQQIVLAGTGTPVNVGTYTFTVTLGGQNCNFDITFVSPSSGGTALVSSYNCIGTNSGALLTGIAASGITHSITANVTTIGTYNLSTNTVNGITYSGSGTFSGTGNQLVVLTASGTPVAYGDNTYTLTSTPACNFNVFTNNGSSGGSAVVSAYDCTGTDAGNLTVGIVPSGVTHVINATVTTAGTYSISAIKNGLTFSAIGTFPGTGSQNITLTATGTPAWAGPQSFLLNVSPTCNFTRVVTPAATFNCANGIRSYFPSGSYLMSANYNGVFTFPYTGGNGTSYGALTTIPVEGLTLARGSGTYAAGGGNITYTLSGTTMNGGANYALFTLAEGCMTTVLNQFVETYAGNGTVGLVNGATDIAQFKYPGAVVINPAGIVYVSDSENHCIRKISGTTVSTFVGNGTAGYADGTGTTAQFTSPAGLWLDSDGNLYIADAGNHRIRKATPGGVVTTLAGSGIAGSANGNGTNAQFYQPLSIVIDGTGNMYISDFDNNNIRKMTLAGDVTNFAGSGVPGFNNGIGIAAQFNGPSGMTIDAAGNIYVADFFNNRIRKITPAAVVTTFAGSATSGSANGTGAAAQFNLPFGLALDGSGNIIVADYFNHKIRRITPATVVTTIAGNGTAGFVNDLFSFAQFNSPKGVGVDSYGRILVADTENQRIRVILP